MDRIAITGIEAFGRHGVLAHERQFGQRFLVDVVLELDLAAAAGSDRLEDTVDYGTVASDAAAVISGEPAALIETVAGRIAERCLRDGIVSSVEVTVHKPSAPLGVLAREVSVTLRRSRPEAASEEEVSGGDGPLVVFQGPEAASEENT